MEQHSGLYFRTLHTEAVIGNIVTKLISNKQLQVLKHEREHWMINNTANIHLRLYLL